MKIVKRKKIKVLVIIMALLVAVVLIFFGVLCRYKADTPIDSGIPNTQPKGLASMTAFDQLPFFKEGTQSHQVSSHDLSGGDNDQGNYLYKQDEKYVIFDVASPGSIYRMWFTGMPLSDMGNIEFYFDGNESPTINMPLEDIFIGTNAPFLSPLVGNDSVSPGGFYSYVPLQFRQSLKIVLTGEPQYYSITYHTYTTAAGVTTYTGNENVANAVNLWNNGVTDPSPNDGNVVLADVTNANAGEMKTIVDLNTRGAINSLKLSISPSNDYLLKNIKLKMYWDNEEMPSVDVPLGDFFGSGISEQYNVRSLPIGIDISGSDPKYYCFLPMPFNKAAKIIISNESDTDISRLYYEVRYNDTKAYVGLGSSAGYFKVQYNSETPTTPGRDYNILNLDNAQGHLVGTFLYMDGPKGRTYLEGDERIYIDDSKTPQIYGTGTEDFVNGGWYFNNTIFSLPVHGHQTNISTDDWEKTAVYRFFLSDAVVFNKSIKAGIEHGNQNNISASYASVAYYYSIPHSGFSDSVDELDVLDYDSEQAHNYGFEVLGESIEYYNQYVYEGDDDDVMFEEDGRAFQTRNQFTMAIDPKNTGVKLRRQFDYTIGNQKAEVYVDNQLTGVWYDSGANQFWQPYNTAKDSDYEIPAVFTTDKSFITVKVVFVSSEYDWNEMRYWAYSYVPYDTDPPAAFELVSPANEAKTDVRTQTLKWQASNDAKVGLAGYNLYLDNAFAASVTEPEIVFNFPEDPRYHKYEWFVVAVDFAGNSRQSTSTFNLIIYDEGKGEPESPSPSVSPDGTSPSPAISLSPSEPPTPDPDLTSTSLPIEISPTSTQTATPKPSKSPTKKPTPPPVPIPVKTPTPAPAPVTEIKPINREAESKANSEIIVYKPNDKTSNSLTTKTTPPITATTPTKDDTIKYVNLVADDKETPLKGGTTIKIYNQRPIIKGQTVANAKVLLTIDSPKTISATVISNGAGDWQYQPEEDLDIGTHKLKVTVDKDNKVLSVQDYSFEVLATDASKQASPSAVPGELEKTAVSVWWYIIPGILLILIFTLLLVYKKPKKQITEE